MLFEDTYLTIKEPSEGLFKDRGSKFSGYAFPVVSEDEIKLRLQEIKKLHPSASHHCYAYRLGADKLIFRANDDGEPSNTAGKPILGQIQSKDLTNVLVVVVRYFGGTLLGVSGLINAYKQAAAEALQNASIFEKTVNDVYTVRFEHLKMNDVMRIIKEEQVKLLSQDSGLDCTLSFSIRKGSSNTVYERMKKIAGLEINFVKTT